MIRNIFPKEGIPSSGKGGWVDPTWDKVLNSTDFFWKASLTQSSIKEIRIRGSKLYAMGPQLGPN